MLAWPTEVAGAAAEEAELEVAVGARDKAKDTAKDRAQDQAKDTAEQGGTDKTMVRVRGASRNQMRDTTKSGEDGEEGKDWEDGQDGKGGEDGENGEDGEDREDQENLEDQAQEGVQDGAGCRLQDGLIDRTQDGGLAGGVRHCSPDGTGVTTVTLVAQTGQSSTDPSRMTRW